MSERLTALRYGLRLVKLVPCIAGIPIGDLAGLLLLLLDGHEREAKERAAAIARARRVATAAGESAAVASGSTAREREQAAGAAAHRASKGAF